MFIILVYDIKEERVNKVYKLCKQYFYHRQKSVFDGNIEKTILDEFLERLDKIINKEYDSVLIYLTKNGTDEIMQIGVKKIEENENIVPPL